MIIYKAQNKINGKIYIGQTKNVLSKRISEHISSNKFTYFRNALLKYGVHAFEFSEVDCSNTQEELNSKEQYWIKFFNCKSPNGYNLTDGGNQNFDFSEDIKSKIIENNKRIGAMRKGVPLSESIKIKLRNFKPSEDHKRKIGEAAKRQIGHVVTDETKEKIRKSHLGVPLSDEAKKNWYVSRWGNGGSRGISG